MLNTRRLSLLRDLVRTGTIAGAAQLAGCTPSAASQQLSALEQEMGTALLERSARSVRLTEAGRILAEHAHRVFVELDAAEAAVRAVSGLRGGTVRIAAFNSVATGLIVPTLMAFRQRHKDVSMTFTEAEPEVSMPAVANGDLDLAITHEYGRLPKPDLNGLHQVLLHHDRMLLAVPPRLQRAGQTTANLRDYADATWLSALPSSGFQAATEFICRAEGFEPDIAFRSDQYDLLMHLVAADFGVALIPALEAAPRQGVTYLEVAQPSGLTHDIHITTRETDTSPAVEALSSLLVQRGIGSRAGA
jgi:DNA-binding transcriptional LysR family regulator